MSLSKKLSCCTDLLHSLNIGYSMTWQDEHSLEWGSTHLVELHAVPVTDITN